MTPDSSLRRVVAGSLGRMNRARSIGPLQGGEDDWMEKFMGIMGPLQAWGMTGLFCSYALWRPYSGEAEPDAFVHMHHWALPERGVTGIHFLDSVCFPSYWTAHAFGVRMFCVVVYSGALRAPLYTTTQNMAGGGAARESGERGPW